jgi:hypothetical protein
MAFQKGNTMGKGRPKGSLNVETMTKLERRAHFEKRAQEKFDKWIDECRAEYGLDQFLGKSPDIIEGVIKTEPSERIKELAKKLADAQKEK